MPERAELDFAVAVDEGLGLGVCCKVDVAAVHVGVVLFRYLGYYDCSACGYIIVYAACVVMMVV